MKIISPYPASENGSPSDETGERFPISGRGNKTPIELFRPRISEINCDVAGLIRDATPDFKSVFESQSAP